MPSSSPPPRPASRVMADELRAAITGGDFGPGSKLPSERQLAQSHGVARNTAREAVRLLTQEGLVAPEHGRGVFVLDTSRANTTEPRTVSLPPLDTSNGVFTGVEINRHPRGRAPEFARDALGLPASARPSCLFRAWLIGDVVRMVENSYYPRHILPNLDGNELPRGVHEHLADLGYKPEHHQDEVSVAPASESEAQSLGVVAGEHLLRVKRLSYTGAGLPVELRDMAFNPGLFSLIYGTYPSASALKELNGLTGYETTEGHPSPRASR